MAAYFYNWEDLKMDVGMYRLYSRSDLFYNRLLSGKCRGRRWNVWDYFQTHFQNLGSVARNLFYYDGYDNKDFFREVEKRYFFYGHTGAVKHNGDLIAVNSYGNTPGIYDKPERFTFNFYGGIQDTAGAKPNEREIGKGGVYGYNNFDGYPTALVVEHYALMLAHTDASITMELVNGRMMDVMKSSDNRSTEAANQYAKRIYDGDYSFIADKSENLEIDRAANSKTSRLRELLDTKERLLHDVYAIFGINRVAEKKERLITDEAEGSGAMLLLNLKDMFEMREKFCEDLNNTFGTNISVKCHIDIDADGKLEHVAEAESNTEPESNETEVSDNV